MTDTLTPTGVHVLLVYGAKIKAARTGQPGIRVTAGYHDGTVLVEAVGFACSTDAIAALVEATDACLDADLNVGFAPRRASRFPARIVSRKVTR